MKNRIQLDNFEYLLDHYKSPRNYGELVDPDISCELGNPICGDMVRMDLKLEGDVVVDIKFSGKGCTISQAAASILSEAVINKDIEYINSLDTEDIFNLLSVELSPIRYDCAILALKVLKTALRNLYN